MYYTIKTETGYWLRSYTLSGETFTADWVRNPSDKGYFFASDLHIIFSNTLHSRIQVYQIHQAGQSQRIDFEKAQSWNVCLN